MNINYKKPNSTQLRSFYSSGLSSLTIAYYNTNLSFRFAPFQSKDAMGKSFYDLKNALATTVDYNGAAALYITAHNIVEGKEYANGVKVVIPCYGGASLILERKPDLSNGQDNQMDTFFVISKNNSIIPFKFTTHPVQRKEDGQMVTKVIESGLGAFARTIDGYLSGIGANIHLNKLGEELEKYQEEGQQAHSATGNNNGSW